MATLEREWTEQYLEYYVKKYLEEYEESTSDTSEGSDYSMMDWDFQKKGNDPTIKTAFSKDLSESMQPFGLQSANEKGALRAIKARGLALSAIILQTGLFVVDLPSGGESFSWMDVSNVPGSEEGRISEYISKGHKTESHRGRKAHNVYVYKGLMPLVKLKMFESTQHYLEHPFSTTKSVKYKESLTFPAVSLCNLNDMRHSRMVGRPRYKLVKTNRIGPQHALELTINIEFWDYYDDAVQSGIHLILHGQEETPVTMEGFRISPGFITYAEVKKTQRRNLPSPYKTQCGSLKLKYFKGYSRNLCWLEQLTDDVVGHCGCKDWFMPGDYKVCSLTELEMCLWSRWVDFDKYKKYSCPLPCVIDSFTTKTSFSRFPTHDGSESMAKELNLNGTSRDNHKFLSDNFLKVVIYYGDLSYEYLEQKPSYDLLVFLGDIGGQIGLFVGASVLTFFEFIDCFLMCIHARFFEIFRPRETQL
eukprot:gene12244-2879_t